MKRYAYFWITLVFFLVSIGLHWLFGWYAYVDEAAEHGQAPEMSAYLVVIGRDTFENCSPSSSSSSGRSSASLISSTSGRHRPRRMTTGSRPRSTRCCG